jgi:hypothetical protein
VYNNINQLQEIWLFPGSFSFKTAVCDEELSTDRENSFDMERQRLRW